MNTSGIIADLLFMDFKQIREVTLYVQRYALLFLPGVFLLSIIIEYFQQWDFLAVVKKTIIAVVVIYTFPQIHQTGVEYSLSASSTFIQNYSRDNIMIKSWKEVLAGKESHLAKLAQQKNDSLTDFFVTNVKFAFSDIISRVIWVLSIIMLFILKQLYSFVYHFTYIFYPICALLSLFPISGRSLSGAIKGTLWCYLMPFVLALMMVIVGNTVGDADNNREFVVTSISGIMQLFVACLMILATAAITQKIIEGTGLGQVAGQIGQMSAMLPLWSAAKMTKTAAAHALLGKNNNGGLGGMALRSIRRSPAFNIAQSPAPMSGFSAPRGLSGNKKNADNFNKNRNGHDHGHEKSAKLRNENAVNGINKMNGMEGPKKLQQHQISRPSSSTHSLTNTSASAITSTNTGSTNSNGYEKQRKDKGPERGLKKLKKEGHSYNQDHQSLPAKRTNTADIPSASIHSGIFIKKSPAQSPISPKNSRLPHQHPQKNSISPLRQPSSFKEQHPLIRGSDNPLLHKKNENRTSGHNQQEQTSAKGIKL